MSGSVRTAQNLLGILSLCLSLFPPPLLACMCVRSLSLSLKNKLKTKETHNLKIAISLSDISEL